MEEASKHIQSESISALDLAGILAEIRVKNGLDFAKRLPIGLQLYYDICVTNEYEDNMLPLVSQRSELEAALKDIEDEKDHANELIKLMRKEKADLEKERLRQPKERNKIEKDISEAKSTVEFYQDRQFSGYGDTAEMRRINKELEKAQLKLISLEASRDHLGEWEVKYQETMQRIQTSLDQAVERRDSLERSRRKSVRELDQIIKAMKDMEDRFKSAKPVTSLTF